MENSAQLFLESNLPTSMKLVSNATDRYAVTVKKDSSKTIGNVLQKISRICSMFLQYGFIITATITGRKISWNIQHL